MSLFSRARAASRRRAARATAAAAHRPARVARRPAVEPPEVQGRALAAPRPPAGPRGREVTGRAAREEGPGAVAVSMQADRAERRTAPAAPREAARAGPQAGPPAARWEPEPGADPTAATRPPPARSPAQPAAPARRSRRLGIVTWSTTLSGVSRRQYRLRPHPPNYGMTAPVDPHREGLPDPAARHEERRKSYHYRIVAVGQRRHVHQPRLHDHDRGATERDRQKPNVTTTTPLKLATNS